MMDVYLNVHFCDESTAGICFQLYARLMYKALSLESVRKFWLDMEDWDPGSCLCPVNGCLHRAGRNIVEVFTVPDQYMKGIGELGMGVSVGMGMHETIIACDVRGMSMAAA